jgi:GNAT superfamily N-acetyltransferase
MHAAEQAARQRGFAVMGLTVHPTNTTAVRFYEKLGWMRVPTNGLWSGRMEKVIAPTPANISHE